MLKRILASILFLAASAAPSVAQSPDSSAKKQEIATMAASQNDARYFRLDFIVRELDGKRTVSSRNYSMILVSSDRSRSHGSIRSGNRVPIPATSKDAQFSYSDVGINIDANFVEAMGAELTLDLSAEISSLSEAAVGTQSTPPILRSTRWHATPLVTIGKPTIVFTAEDEHTNHTLDLEVTATPLH